MIPGHRRRGYLVILNFENHDVPVKVDFHTTGRWVKLADIEQVNDLPPVGTKTRMIQIV